MSIITTWEAVPSRLFSLYASLIVHSAGESRIRLEGLATPPSLSNRGTSEEGAGTTTLFNRALGEALNVGLLDADGDRLRISDAARRVSERGGSLEDSFRRFMIEVLFNQERAEVAQQGAFMLALAWFLTKSPLIPQSFRNDPQSLLRSDLGDRSGETELKVVSDYQNFLYWARFLGFATIVGGRDADENKDARWAFPDPLAAIDPVLTVLFGKDNELSIGAFMARLCDIYPVFEGGTVRQQIESISGSSPYADQRRLSPATSIALQRLQDRKRLELVSRADAPIVILDLGVRELRVSHIVKKGLA